MSGIFKENTDMREELTCVPDSQKSMRVSRDKGKKELILHDVL